MVSETFIKTKSEELGMSSVSLRNLASDGFFDSEESFDKFINENPFVKTAKPLVKWVGGKRSILKELEAKMPESFANYFEPFVGGASVFFHVLKKNAKLSDLNAELINMYRTVKSSPDELVAFLKTLNYDEKTYYGIRAWDRSENWIEKKTEIERAGRFLYLNKTCFNGVYRVNSKGENNVPMGRYSNPDFVQEENVKACSKLFNLLDVEFFNRPYKDIEDEVSENDFVYLDPPYDVLTETAKFTSYDKEGFGKKEQEELSDFVRRLKEKKAFAMVSNHETEFIKKIYSGLNVGTLNVKRAVSGKNSGRNPVSEVIITTY